MTRAAPWTRRHAATAARAAPSYGYGSDFDAETCGGFGNNGDRDTAGSPGGFDAALYSGHSEGGNFNVAPYGNCNERDFDVGNAAMTPQAAFWCLAVFAL